MNEHDKTQITVLVLGGYGFIGRHAVKHLQALGANVLIGTRGQGTALNPGDRRITLQTMKHTDHWHNELRGVDVVINTVGILRQRYGETYEQVHHYSVATLAEACHLNNVRLVHVSALGLNNPLKSRFTNSKRRGEQALKKSKANWLLVKPSLVEGQGGFGASWFQRVAHWPVHFAPANALGIISPIHVEQLGKALANLAIHEEITPKSTTDNKNRVFELSGGKSYTLLEYLRLLKGGAPRATVRVPAWLARLTAHICDVLHLTPFSFGHYELLKFDNAPSKNRLLEILNWPCRLS